MRNLIVVSDPEKWPLELPGAEVVAARAYLTEPRFANGARARVFNLCRSYRYQRTGYYVSLLAEARGHRPLPGIATIQELKTPAVIRVTASELDDVVQRSLRPIESPEFILSVYFGRSLAERHRRLARALFQAFPIPLMRAWFTRQEQTGRWVLDRLGPIGGDDVPESHLSTLLWAAEKHFSRGHRSARERRQARYDLAILRDPEEKEPPSDEVALRRFARAGARAGLDVTFVDRDDYARIAEFDALFIRETTAVNHHTFRFSTRAAAAGLVVIDDPASILRCSNKVFLAEILARHNVPTPRTLIVHRGNAGTVADALGLPCVLKQPDSSFSRGVIKVETREELEREVSRLLDGSDLIVAQQFTPTPFDWRIGVLAGKPLYACKYFMARAHWQIYNRQGARTQSGNSETFPIEQAPAAVVEAAVTAARLMGDGLYGVDAKEIDGRGCIIEVNDNPNIDGGSEDAVLKDALYDRIIGTFLERLERARETRP